MRVERYEGTRENLILSAMISNSEALARIQPLWQKDLFRAQSSNLLGKLCVQYFDQYGEAPGKTIDALVRSWYEKDPDREQQAEVLEKQLDVLRPSYQDKRSLNVQYILDIFNRYCREVQIRRLGERLQDRIDAGSFDEAETILAEEGTRTIQGVGDDTDTFLLNDDSELLGAFDNSLSENLIKYRDGLKEFWGTSLQRENFISFIAPEGTGKSWWLLDMAHRAVSQRRRVAFFEVGDMTKRQLVLRWAIRLQKKPLRPGTVQWPVGFDDGCEADHEVREYNEGVSREGMLAARNQFLQDQLKSNDPYLFISVRPAGTVSVAAIEAQLRRLARQRGWIPDCVFIDYADLLAAPKGYRMEVRDQIAETWKQLRALSMTFHCLLVTATQCNREGYDAKGGLRMRHISEEKRKASHVTGLVGINVTDQEKANGMYRLNWLKARDMEFRSNRFVYCAGCLALGRPAILSIYPKTDPARKKKKDGGGSRPNDNRRVGRVPTR